MHCTCTLERAIEGDGGEARLAMRFGSGEGELHEHEHRRGVVRRTRLEARERETVAPARIEQVPMRERGHQRRAELVLSLKRAAQHKRTISNQWWKYLYGY